jgi:hypothetical protein
MIFEGATGFQNRIPHFLLRHSRYLGRSFHRATSTGLENAHFALISIAAAPWRKAGNFACKYRRMKFSPSRVLIC